MNVPRGQGCFVHETKTDCDVVEDETAVAVA